MLNTLIIARHIPVARIQNYLSLTSTEQSIYAILASICLIALFVIGYLASVKNKIMLGVISLIIVGCVMGFCAVMTVNYAPTSKTIAMRPYMSQTHAMVHRPELEKTILTNNKRIGHEKVQLALEKNSKSNSKIIKKDIQHKQNLINYQIHFDNTHLKDVKPPLIH